MKKQNGITLIALVITIIVLLILAGVSISLVIGDNGILTQATEAVTENRKASVSEDIAMAWAGLETEYVRNWTKNTSTPKSNYFNESKFVTTLESKGKITNDSFIYNEDNGEIIFKYTANSDDGKEYAVAIDKNGKVVLDGWASKITAANYGDYVDYPVDINDDGETEEDWEIFYSNGNKVFLIASDYIDKGLVTEKMTKHDDESFKYSVYWGSVPEMSVTARKDTLFGITSSSYKLNSNNPNSICTSTLLDTANWTNFKDTNGYGEYVIGSPTIEMWINSWNAKGTELGTDKYEKLKTQKGTYGYYIGPEETDLEAVATELDATQGGYYYSITTNSKPGHNDRLYFPHQSAYGECWGYYLASPNTHSSSSIMSIRYSGSINRYGYNGIDNNAHVGVRPVVALSSEVIGTKVDGIWQLRK